MGLLDRLSEPERELENVPEEPPPPQVKTSDLSPAKVQGDIASRESDRIDDVPQSPRLSRHGSVNLGVDELDNPDGPLGQTKGLPEREDGTTDRSIAESLEETGKALGDWLCEKVLELAADALHPGLGHFISVGFKVKEAVGDVEALVDPESGSDVHVPLLSIPPGFEIELSLHLPGHDRAGTDGPWVSGFLLPGDGGGFGTLLQLDKLDETYTTGARVST